MIQNLTYTVEVWEEVDLEQTWTDDRLPNMAFCFDQTSLSECQFIDGKYYATYQTWIVTEPQVIQYINTQGKFSDMTISVGEYGLRP